MAREIEYVGTVRKCPNCGAELKSFTAFCPNCRHELNSVKNETVAEFVDNLNNFTSFREKIQYIRSFQIPSTKEDLIEFAIFAKSQYIEDADDNTSILQELGSDATLEEYNKTWVLKMEQILMKAKLLFANDNSAMMQIQLIADSFYKTDKKEKNKKILQTVCFSILAVVFLAAAGVIYITSSKKMDSEDQRLEALYEAVIQDIENENYTAAELKLNQLEWSVSTLWDEFDKREKFNEKSDFWNKKRESLEKMIDNNKK